MRGSTLLKYLGMYPVPFHWYMDGTGNFPLVYGRNGKYSIIVPLDYWNSSTGILESGSTGTLESGSTGSKVYYSTVLYGTIYYSTGMYSIIRTK